MDTICEHVRMFQSGTDLIESSTRQAPDIPPIQKS
jgi:hypothetical protein